MGRSSSETWGLADSGRSSANGADRPVAALELAGGSACGLGSSGNWLAKGAGRPSGFDDVESDGW
jgi:hypothetical protein